MSGRMTLGGMLAVAALGACALAAAPANADVTIGDDVNNATVTTLGTCQGNGAASCVVVSMAPIQGGPLTSPCDGTVTRFRINGVPTSSTYRLRVVHLSGTTATAVSASSAALLTTDGVNTFPASLPIHTGDQLGLEFTQPYSFMSVRARQPAPTDSFQDGIPDSGSATATSVSSNGFQYLVNADVACGTGGQGGPNATTPKCKKKKHKREASAAKKKRCKKKKK